MNIQKHGRAAPYRPLLDSCHLLNSWLQLWIIVD